MRFYAYRVTSSEVETVLVDQCIIDQSLYREERTWRVFDPTRRRSWLTFTGRPVVELCLNCLVDGKIRAVGHRDDARWIPDWEVPAGAEPGTLKEEDGQQ